MTASQSSRSKLLDQQVKLLETRAEPEEARALEVIFNDASTRGVGRSGWVVETRHERRLETLRSLLAERVGLERQYPLAPEDSVSWHTDLVTAIDQLVNGGRARCSSKFAEDWRRCVGGELPEELQQRLREDLERLRKEYLEEAEIIRQERKLVERVENVEPAPAVAKRRMGFRPPSAGDEA